MSSVPNAYYLEILVKYAQFISACAHSRIAEVLSCDKMASLKSVTCLFLYERQGKNSFIKQGPNRQSGFCMEMLPV